MKTLLAIDGNSIINRAFYGVKPLTNKNGQQTGAVFGMLNIILSHIEHIRPDYTAVAFDMRHPTFRHAMYDGYKGNRKGMPEELASQMPYARAVLSAMGITVLEKQSYEADDILGTLARMSEEENCRCFLLTGDRDSLQLISDTTSVLLAGNTETVTYDRAKFFEKYGIMPESFVELKALMGDSSDCIPGVPGVGEKTAQKLLMQFGSLDGIFQNKNDPSIKPAMQAKLTEGEKLAYLSLDLARICREVPLDVTLSDIEHGEGDRGELKRLFAELEFGSFIKRMGLDKEEAVEAEGKSREIERKDVEISVICSLAEDKPLAVTVAENTLFVFDEGVCYYCEFADFSALLPFFTAQRRLILSQIKPLYRRLLAVGAEELPACEDCSLAAYVLNASMGDYGFSALALAYLARTVDGEEPADVYALWQILYEKMEAEGVVGLYKDLELPLSATLARMEHAGFRVDREGLAQYSARLEEMAEDYARRIYDLAEGEFNIQSPKQLGEILFEKLGLPALKKTKSGYSTNAEVLEKLRPYHPIIDLILEYRKVAKLRSTYTEGLLRVADEDGVVHTQFKQTGTATGRLSSAEPNLQNIPIRTEMGHELRRYFLPSAPGRLLVDADYSQIELRVLAHMANESTMQQAFGTGVDIHTVTASQVFGCMPELVTPEMRKRAKAVNFGIVYGISDFSLAGDIGVTKKQAGEYIKGYFATYPGIRAFMDGAVEGAKELGYTETLLGRRRYIPELSSGKAVLRAFGERVAMNSPIQGSAADIIKIAMLRTEKALREAKIDAKLILQVHDELVVDASLEDAPRAAEILKREMENAVSLSVPLTVELSIGATWYENK